ncbi:serine/threonine protein kinase [Streptomyces chattanoogensis]|uniref:Serine/threonine protein kinase n=1 Tax=Streptomyces chattanoogensis TaxID=66876 RepID=A0A0N0XZS6_9ACTN|nr:serine/threonine protein kinase [Streptomyces chattanoogensis]KPC66577.1 serine/threonine protein kinase [Streptomyces chattanoogensis]
MERLRQDDPARIGDFVTLARLDADGSRGVPERRYLARSADGGRTVLVCLPPAGGDPARWAAEAQQAARLTQPGFWPVVECGGTSAFPWYASPYRPALPLPAVLAAHGGPLPEPLVRMLGGTLAEALASAHVLGIVHGGVCPAGVLLTACGPFLGCFGAMRATAVAGASATPATWLDTGCLAPELAAGAPVDRAGDVYALGAVLAYAATGHTVPERQEIPAGLRDIVTACRSRDADRRPEPARVLAELLPGAAYGALAGSTEPVSLPGRVVAALSRQSAEVLAAALPTQER